MQAKYEVTCEEKKNENAWSSTIVSIWLVDNAIQKTKIGEYERNYPSYNKSTFFPFSLNGKDYALYSRDYTATRVMTLPDCKDLCGEEPDAVGFCPVEYFVPFRTNEKDCSGDEDRKYLQHVPLGFVAGCIWGDDTSWKIECLDLRNIDKGVLKRDDRFGYIELSSHIPLRDAIDFEDETIYNEFSDKYKYTTSRLKIARTNHYSLRNEDYTINNYYNDNFINDLFCEIKCNGLNNLTKKITRYVEWHVKYKPEHKFSEDEMKFIDMIKHSITGK